MNRKTTLPVSDSVIREIYNSPVSLPGRHKWLTRKQFFRKLEKLLGMPPETIGAPLWVSGDNKTCPKCQRETNWLDIVSPALSTMPMTPVVPMVAADLTGHPPLHEAAQCSDCGRLHHQVNMIRHQTEATHVDWMLGFRRGEQVEQVEEGGVVVALLVKDHGTAVPTIEHMVGVAGDLTARNARYGGLE